MSLNNRASANAVESQRSATGFATALALWLWVLRDFRRSTVLGSGVRDDAAWTSALRQKRA